MRQNEPATLTELAEAKAASRELSLGENEEPTLTFESVMPRVWRHRHRRFLTWAATMASAAALLAAIATTRASRPGQYSKGEAGCCGVLSLRVAPGLSDEPMRIWVDGARGHLSVFDVHLASAQVRELIRMPLENDSTELRLDPWPPAEQGKHVILAVAADQPGPLERGEVIALLHALADNAPLRVAGEPVSATLVEVMAP